MFLQDAAKPETTVRDGVKTTQKHVVSAKPMALCKETSVSVSKPNHTINKT